ncbi:MAG TPA: hypothetical protein VG738_17025 [Chitinophagaceae bacterium]|nr:hypothetical protein [Chitinophagaceae bacterium]
MNSNVTHSVLDMDNDDLKNLTGQVKETVATNVDISKATSKNIFAAANLWHIQRMKKSSQGRRAVLWN